MSNSFRKLVCTKLGTDFRQVTKVVDVPHIHRNDVPRGHLLVRNKFVGINASDINYTAGRYAPGVKPPFDVGFEAVGEVVAHNNDTHFHAGQKVGVVSFGAFSEYQLVHQRQAFPIPDAVPQILPLLVSGLTASIALEQVGEMKIGDTVLVTAAAGATGAFAVQLAKQAGCRVFGTCSSEEKVQELLNLGCDRPINYTKESVKAVLRSECPDGVDIVYESVGGEMYETCVNALATHGKLIIIGFLSGYQDEGGWTGEGGGSASPLPPRLLRKSASVRGFFLNDFHRLWPQHIQELAFKVARNELQPLLDPTRFKGLESIADAVEHMYEKKNVGKIVVELPQTDV